MANANFIDYVKIHCKSGNGGPGSTHLHRSKITSKGGPDGGDGGRGGHVIVRGDKQLWTLLHLKFKKHIKAEHGGSGSGNLMIGSEGEDMYIDVPLGSVIRNPETEEIIAEITEPGQEFILMRGGRGGKGNAHFKTSTNQTPRYSQPGEDHQEDWRVIELKVLADVGLVGFPNAGKSTLLSVVSEAKPEIANYPFTTLVPNLGVVAYRDNRSFIMADIPGIIEGASEGKGLGYRFLRHIERNSCLLFLIPADSEDHLKEYRILVNELEKYNPDLLDKKHLVTISKSDMLDEELMAEIREQMPEVELLFFSSVAQQGLLPLKDLIWNALNE
ncbi:MAG: GTPase ObgE [Flavobacteriales bacterium]